MGDVYFLVSTNSEVKGIKRRVYKIKDGSSSKKKLWIIMYIMPIVKKILRVISSFFLERIMSFSFFLSTKFIVVITKARIDQSARLLLKKSKTIESASNK